jgi:hypothetical protein
MLLDQILVKFQEAVLYISRKQGCRLTDALRTECASLPLDEAAWYMEFGASPFGEQRYSVRFLVPGCSVRDHSITDPTPN